MRERWDRESIHKCERGNRDYRQCFISLNPNSSDQVHPISSHDRSTWGVHCISDGDDGIAGEESSKPQSSDRSSHLISSPSHPPRLCSLQLGTIAHPSSLLSQETQTKTSSTVYSTLGVRKGNPAAKRASKQTKKGWMHVSTIKRSQSQVSNPYYLSITHHVRLIIIPNRTRKTLYLYLYFACIYYPKLCPSPLPGVRNRSILDLSSLY